ncbi:MAG: phosphate acyltransferase PlsX [Dehalococcoidales bacterium]|jgi:glycerol-3-phosphate acyltransferase PlsX
MKIVIDAAGGDYAPHEVVKGAIKAVQEYGVEIILVGRQNVVRKLAEKALTLPGLTIVDAAEVIDFGEHPIRALQNKPHSSIVVGINLLKNGQADAFVSAGNTGAVVAAALLNLGKAKGVSRPAIGCFLDRISTKPALLVDAGANAECRPEHLLEFARLGTIYSKYLLKIPSPKVGLLCNGREEGKGNRLVQETYQLLKEAKDINFIGNIEGHDIVKKTADVVVTDGFTGNIVLKTIEGHNDSFLAAVKQMGQVFSSASRVQSKDLLHDVGLNTLTRRLDYSEYGGAYLLGVNGNVIIAHGRSKAKAIKNAIGLARATVERNITEKIREGKYEQTSGSTGS